MPGRAFAAQEPFAGNVAAQSQTVIRGTRETTERAGPIAQASSRFRRSLRTHTHVQFSARPRHGPSHQSHALQARRCHERQSRRAGPRAEPRTSGRRAGAAGRMNAMPTIAEIVKGAALTLHPHSESPRLDAELLLGKVLGLS